MCESGTPVTGAKELSSSTPQAPRAEGETTQHWAVTVSRNGTDILTIESNCLSGRDLSPEDARIVRDCGRHLLAFIGDPATPSPSGTLVPALRVKIAEWREDYERAITHDKVHGLRDMTTELGGKAEAADELEALLPADSAPSAQPECSHGHKVRQVSCVSCVLVFDKPNAFNAEPYAGSGQS